MISATTISPLNRRILDGGGGFDPAASAIIAQMTANGSTPSEARQAVINQLVLDLKGIGNTGADDVWSKLEYLNIHAAEDEIQALTEWKHADGTYDAINVNSAAFTTDIGFTGSLSATIRYPFVLNTSSIYLQNDASFGCLGTPSIGLQPYLKGINFTQRAWIRASVTSVDQALNATTFANGNFGAATRGLYYLDRNTSANFVTVKDATIISTITNTSSGRPTTSAVAPGLSTGPSTFSAGNTSQIEASFAGASIRAYAAQFYNSLNNYLTSL